MSGDRFLDELRAEVLDAAERTGRRPAPRRRVPLARLAAAAAAVVVLVAGLLVARPDTVAAGVEITRDGPDLVVRLTDTDVQAAEIEAAASESGIDVTVTEEPVGPSLVGRFFGSSASELPPLVQTVEGDPSAGFNGFRIPADYDGSLTLRLGRAAGDGEQWAALSDATAPGEVLACEDLTGATLEEVTAAVRERGAELRVLSLDLTRWLEDGELAAHADDVTIRLSSPGPDVVWADVSTNPERHSLGMGDPGPHEDC